MLARRLGLAALTVALCGAALAPVASQANESSSSSVAACEDSHTPGDGFTAPAPEKHDNSGSSNDFVIIPDDYPDPDQNYGSYFLNGRVIGFGKREIPPGTSRVEITTSNDDGSWTFCFSSEDTGKTKPNKYGVTIGDRSFRAPNETLYKRVTADVTNVCDAVGERIESIFPEVMRLSDNVRAQGTFFDQPVDDCESASIPVHGNASGLNGLPKGRYVLKWLVTDGDPPAHTTVDRPNRFTVHETYFTVGDVAGGNPPPGEPGSPGARSATGSLMQMQGTKRLRVVMNNRSDARSAYRLTVDPVRGATVNRRYSVPAETKKTVVYRNAVKAKAGTAYKLAVEIKRGNKLVWKTLAKRTAK